MSTLRFEAPSPQAVGRVRHERGDRPWACHLARRGSAAGGKTSHSESSSNDDQSSGDAAEPRPSSNRSDGHLRSSFRKVGASRGRHEGCATYLRRPRHRSMHCLYFVSSVSIRFHKPDHPALRSRASAERSAAGSHVDYRDVPLLAHAVMSATTIAMKRIV